MTDRSSAQGVNRTKPDRWKADIRASVDMYNEWFMNFAPVAFRETRVKVTSAVEQTLQATGNMADLTSGLLKAIPGALPTLRMSTCPPLAVDRLVGLAGVSKNLVSSMETGRLPPRMLDASLEAELARIASIILRMADPDIFVWLGRGTAASELEVHRSATIVADRLCGSVANPIIRNAQERRQLAALAAWLQNRGYVAAVKGVGFRAMVPGTFAFHLNVPVKLSGGQSTVGLPVDAAVLSRNAQPGTMPLLIEAKSAGDFTNVNKRRKEEATKMAQLRATYGGRAQYILFLCGYFDSGYLGYEAAEGIDWVWEHRIDEFAEFGL